MGTALLDRAFTLVLLGLGLFITWGAWNYGLYQNGIPGPGFFPILAGLMMTILAAALLLRDLSGRMRLAGRIDPVVMLAIAAVTGAIVLFVYLAPLTGMGLAAFAVMVGIGYVTEESHRRGRFFLLRLVLVSAGTVVLCHFFFAKVIGTPLVTGPLGF
ncbi:hypothetical protein Snov_3575 [Ancylobacter novellus DSM 506]|uniref:DUF1468 domain-containing protein n=1 Tax=Ancylobacter novellus (strain ATCC 8093 / DSM 506 / JCM 20403 / CCM 1077 / IAM 12100 / NBRC 12443 / NCIMB 10456) TaxID=639283 RepID=D7AA62_ANCN5|nr:tripartite tricarboxylate transporter TctB family protein [Ancylobacter novellus]ADH90849.1 hypothetical protein Snov_3575 [Ancylobacter novellus DSM 506]